MSTTSAHGGARFVAWSGFALGSLVSIAGNWLAAWLATPENPIPNPTIATQIGAAVWPVMLLIAIEVLSRTPWKATWQWTLVRFGGVGVVAAGSAVISYGHIHEVLLSWGYDWIGAGVGPLVVDGLMTISGFALLAISQPTVATARAGTSVGERDAGTVATRDGSAETTKRRRPTKVVAERVQPAIPSQDAAAIVPPAVSSRPERDVPMPVIPPAVSRPAEHAPASRDVPQPLETGTQDGEQDAATVPAQRPASQEWASWEEMAATLKPQASITDQDAWAVIRAYRDADQDGRLPTANLLKNRLGLGHGRASRLLRDVDSPDAGRPDLHTVRVEAS